MERVVFLVDGFNLYHALKDETRYHRYRWLNLDRLCRCYLTQKQRLDKIFYFTALCLWDPEKRKRHQTYIKALQSRGIQVVFGEFKRRDKMCRLCHRTYQTYEEKRTDVNIAITLFSLAIQDRYDTAMILSGDGDLIPAIDAVRRTFPNKRIGVVIPPGRHAEAMKQSADFHAKVKEVQLQSSLFEAELDIGHGEKIVCPEPWR